MTIVFPLKTRTLIRGFAEHIAAGLGGATDYSANFDAIFSPVDGQVTNQYFGYDGGNWLWIKDADGRFWQFAHLSSYQTMLGEQVKAGQFVGRSGDSGHITTGPHLHLQVISTLNGNPILGKRLDPEILLAKVPLPMEDTSDIDGYAVVQNPGGRVAFVKGGKKHWFQPDEYVTFVNDAERYTFFRTSKFIPAARFNALPLGTLTAGQVLAGKKDW